jgi:hypothetical protein
MLVDRRTRRAHAPLRAAEHLLAAHRERCGARAVVLFDGRAMLASSALAPADEATLRMWIGDLAHGGTGPSRDIYLHRVPLWGRQLTLASLDGRVGSVKAVASGLSRILAG